MQLPQDSEVCVKFNDKTTAIISVLHKILKPYLYKVLKIHIHIYIHTYTYRHYQYVSKTHSIYIKIIIIKTLHLNSNVRENIHIDKTP